MSGKKKKKKNAGPPLPMVRLSQCMIVKNEEKNIEKALSWAKGIAFEQIVVDTGSTDRTVEIAESLGAKVYHFEWIDDFSAAKNFALDQTTGNWVAFLDADEFFSPVDAKRVLIYLRNIMSDFEMRKKHLALNCKISNVDENGKPFSVFVQERVFRKSPEIRYIGKIHEQLNVPRKNVARAEEITIIHTGYSRSAYEATGKTDRNIELISREIEENPKDANLSVYLADSLWVRGSEGDQVEALKLYAKAIESNHDLDSMLKKNSYLRLIETGINASDTTSQTETLCRRALDEWPGDMDIEFFLAIITYNNGKHYEAWEMFKEVESKLVGVKSLDDARILTAKPVELFTRMMIVADALGDVQGVIRYAMMVLTADKTQEGVLAPVIQTLLRNDTSEDEVLGLISKIYDMDNPRDLLQIARAAKDCGAKELAVRVVEMIKT